MQHQALFLLVSLTSCFPPPASLVSGTQPATVGERAPTGLAEPVRLGWSDAARGAVRRALPFIEHEGIAWMEGRIPMQGGEACVSCHHVGYAVWSHAEARRAGMTIPAPAAALVDTAVAFLGQPSIPRAMSAAQVVMAEPDRSAELTAALLDLQNPSGGWSARGQFPTQRRPTAESDAVATHYALLALDAIVPGEQRDALAAARRSALEWLASQPAGTSTEWLATRLMLVVAHGSADEVEAQRRRLIDRQQPDGGWGWTAEAASDPFSTGQALFALATLASRDREAIDSAVAFLLATQDRDGSWPLSSGVISREPSPSKDDIYRFWSTAWATIGLARALRT